MLISLDKIKKTASQKEIIKKNNKNQLLKKKLTFNFKKTLIIIGRNPSNNKIITKNFGNITITNEKQQVYIKKRYGQILNKKEFITLLNIKLFFNMNKTNPNY